MAAVNSTVPSEPDAFAVYVSGDWSAVDLIHRLATGGLTLDDRNGQVWLVMHDQLVLAEHARPSQLLELVEAAETALSKDERGDVFELLGRIKAMVGGAP